MADITAAAVKSLRDRTDLPMMQCKKALVEAGGDEEKAIALIKEKLAVKVKERADNEANEGRVFVLASDDGSEVAAVELRCESEPVAGSPGFTELGEAMVKQLLTGPGAASADELLAQDAPSGGTLKDAFDDLVTKIQEKFEVAKVVRHQGPAGVYLHHDGKVASLFLGSDGSDEQTLKDVAMHIAAMRPKAMTADDVDPAAIEEQKQKLTEEAKASGKPDNIVEKIVGGQLKRWLKEEAEVLLEQPFAKDDSKSVSQVLAEKGITPRGFELFVIGA